MFLSPPLKTPLHLSGSPKLDVGVALDKPQSNIAAMVVDSVRRTRRLVIAHETWVTGSFGAEVAATVAGVPHRDLLAPIKRVGAAPVPGPSGPLRARALPTSAQIVAAIRAALED